MLIDARDLSPGIRIDSDVCIAGAGAAGITLATALRGSGLSVCLLESGGFERDEASQRLYDGREGGLASADPQSCRLRYFGGTTGHWTGWCRPLEATDLQPREWVLERGWPLTLAELAPYYRRAQRTCELGAFEYDAVVSDGRLRGCLPLDPGRVRTVVYQASPPTRFGVRYRQELTGDPNVCVCLHANLVEIVLHADAQAVQELRCSTLEGVGFTARSKAYVLAAGGIENARLLLASNRQRPAGIGNDHDLVGRFFMQHPHYYDGAYVLLPHAAHLRPYRLWRRVPTRDPEDGEEREASVLAALALGPGLVKHYRLPALACTLRGIKPEDWEGSTGSLGARTVAALHRRSTGSERLWALTPRSEQRPLRDSRVQLGTAVDALGMPRVEVHWRIADQDRQDLRRSLQLIGAEVGRAGLGRLWMPLDEGGRYRHEEVAVRGGCHHMGTTRMSASPREGVVDRQCRVHGVRNLYVAGSSVFPTTGFANPTLTIVALAHRLADHLREQAL